MSARMVVQFDEIPAELDQPSVESFTASGQYGNATSAPATYTADHDLIQILLYEELSRHPDHPPSDSSQTALFTAEAFRFQHNPPAKRLAQPSVECHLSHAQQVDTSFGSSLLQYTR